MIPLKLSIHNFRSIESMEIAFPEGKPGQLIFVSGENMDSTESDDHRSNGSGKSSIFSAWMWCLYGSTESQSAGSRLSHNHNTTIRVKFEFSIGDTVHSIERHSKPAKVLLDGNSVTESEILGILGGLSKESFMESVYFPQGFSSKILSSPVPCFQLFSKLCGHDRFMEISERIKKHKKAKSDEQYGLASSLLDLKNRATELEKDISGMMEGYNRELENSQLLEKEVLENRARLDEVSKVGKGLILEDGYARFCTEYEEYVRDMHSCRSKVLRLIGQLKTDPSVCPTCGQEIHSHSKLVSPLYGEYREARRNVFFHKPKYTEITEKINLLSELNALRINTERNLQIASARLDEKISHLKNYQNLVDDKKSKLHALRRKIGEVEQSSKQVSKAMQFMDDFNTWILNLSVHIMDSFIDELSMKSTALFNELGVPGDFRFVVKNRDDPGKPMKIVQEVKVGEETYQPEELSGGEMQLLEVSLVLAVSSYVRSSSSVKIPLLVLDEPVSCVDTAGVEKLASLLKDYAVRESVHVVLIEHQRAADLTFDARWHIMKKDGKTLFCNAGV